MKYVKKGLVKMRRHNNTIDLSWLYKKRKDEEKTQLGIHRRGSISGE